MLKVAQVLKSNGTDGELLVSFFGVGPEDIDPQEPVFIIFDGLPVPYFFESFRTRGANRAMVRLTGVRSLQDADELSGRDIFADYFEAVEPDSLTGWKVISALGEPVGTIVALEDIPGNTCAYVDTPRGEVLLPLHRDLVLALDEAARTITLQIPEGLL